MKIGRCETATIIKCQKKEKSLTLDLVTNNLNFK